MTISTEANTAKPQPSLETFNKVSASHGKAAASRLLFSWLSCDRARAILYTDMVDKKKMLEFESRALVDNEADCNDDDRPKRFRQSAYLVVHPDHVQAAYRNADDNPPSWSHSPYKDLGGTFMLALDEPSGTPDPFHSHDAQRAYCYQLLQQLTPHFDAIATVAFKAGAALALKQRKFDLAEVAEMVACYYVASLFGFSQADLPMLKSSAQHIGNGLMQVNFGQHFITDAVAIPQAKLALAKLSNRAAELIDLYDRPVGKDQADHWRDLLKELDELRDYWFEDPSAHTAPKKQLLKARNFRPLMQLMAQGQNTSQGTFGYSTTEKAILVAGLVSGTITNLRAAVCIAIHQFFLLPETDLDTIRTAAANARLKHQDANWNDLPEAAAFRAYLEEALRRNPPPPFVPRRAAHAIRLDPGSCVIPAGSLIIIAVGGGSWLDGEFSMQRTPSTAERPGTLASKANASSACPFSMAFGGRPETTNNAGRAEHLHSCIGKDMAMYSLSYTVRQLLLLPGLTQSLDDSSGEILGLTKRAGFICERYPLEYEREKLLRQSPLQTVLYVKNPVPEHAAALRQVLQFGAPFIERVLRDARHVHFASFMLLDNDTKLVLFTAYDGDFDAYIGHFAREFGPLFDRFFSHIENGPPTPIAEHPFEFVQFLRHFQQPAVGGLFFSAYPHVQTHQIVSHFNKNRDYDFFTLEGGA